MDPQKEIKTIHWIAADSPDRIEVEAGEVYMFTYPISTRAGHNYDRGDLLFVHRQTTDSPFNEVGPRGFNWHCRTRFGVSVWSTLESCIERGLLTKVYKDTFEKDFKP